MRAGRSSTVYGYLKPRHTARSRPVRVYKYRLTSGAWKWSGFTSAVVSDHVTYSKYSRSISLPYKGRWRLKAYAPADSGHASAWSSKSDYVTVR